MIGKTISHYRILSKLGQGGMGEVYLAEDTRLGHKVAIKKLPEHVVADRGHRARFEREARAVAHLTDPNILTLHEYDEIDGDLYFVMEYAGGGSLADVLAGSPDGVDLARVLRWGAQAAEGLAAAHAQGIHHRDIKPANLLLTDDGDLRIADFGLARGTTDTQITQTGAVLGTLAFMSPEQMAGQEADERSDIFSLGATLCELLRGRRDGQSGVAYAASETSAEFLRESRTDLPAGLAELLSEMLDKDSGVRLGSASEVAARLQAIRGSRASGATIQMPRAEGAPRSPRRWPLLLVAAAAVVIAVLGIRLLGTNEADGGLQTVAVLPLRDVSADGTEVALAAGLTEAIIADLGRIKSISVISRRSAEKFAATDLSIPEIGDRLGADAILDASVMRVGDRVQLRAALVDAHSDKNLWSTDFEQELTDVIALQQDVSIAIAEGIRAELTAEEAAAHRTGRRVDPVAFERYTQARALWRQREAAALDEAISIYRDLIEDHPDFVEAWIGLADILVVQQSYADVTPNETFPEARRCAMRAIEIDPNHAGAWNVLAEIAWVYDFDYPESERLRKRSLELNPSSATTRQWYGEFLTAMGRHDEALEQMHLAQRLDPMAVLMVTLQTAILTYARRFDEAIQLLDELTETLPESPHLWNATVRVLRSAGVQSDRAFAADLKRRKRGGFSEEQLSELEAAYAEEGYLGVSKWFRRDEERRLAEGEHVKSRWVAGGYAWMQDADNAIVWLEKSYQDRDISLLRLKVAAEWDFMRQDPRFQEILRRINLLPES